MSEINASIEQVLSKLPGDLVPSIREFASVSRHDWRICKRTEACQIDRLQRFIKFHPERNDNEPVHEWYERYDRERNAIHDFEIECRKLLNDWITKMESMRH